MFLTVALIVGAVVAGEEHRRRLAEEINRANVLEQVNHQRAALLRSVSHDLRTPLATIRTAASELQAGAVRDEGTRQELLALVGDEADRLDRLVANLLDLSRIEAGVLRPDRQAIDLRELIEDRRASLGAVLHGVTVCVDVAPDVPAVSADYSQLGQVLANLLENAARHSPSGGTVTVTAAARPDAVEVVVTDEGKGVAPEDRAVVFEPFRTGQGSQSTGIGLAICKALVEAHGGTIWLATGTAGGRPSTSPLRWAMADAILVVEDEPGMARVLQVGLTARGYDVRIATDGRQALAAVHYEEPAVVLLDLGLPDMDGLDVSQRLQRSCRSSIIVLTADGADDRKIVALDGGAVDYITKPFSIDELLARIRVRPPPPSRGSRHRRGHGADRRAPPHRRRRPRRPRR